MKEGERRDRFLVDQMLAHIRVIEAGIRRGKPLLEEDQPLRYSVEHVTELLADAAEKVSNAFKGANPGIQWDRFKKLRHDVAHPYDLGAEPVNVDELWRFGMKDVPNIARRLRSARFPPSSAEM